MLRQLGLYICVTASFVLSELLAYFLGVRFTVQTLDSLYQYLDPVLLRSDLLQSLLYLHAQPPLFNLFLGLVLKLFPQSYAAVFGALYGFIALCVLIGMAWLMRKLQVPDGITVALCLFFALSPAFPVYRHWLFYTFPVAALLLGSAIALLRFLETERRWPLLMFLSCVTAVMLTRSVFHPLWLIVVLVSLLPFVRNRKRIAGACLVPLLIMNVWFLKNTVLVGSYSSSTWLGLSLTKRWPLSQQQVAKLKSDDLLPQFWGRRPFQEPNYYVPFGFFGESEYGHAAIGKHYKSNGEPNFNHRDYVSISDALFDADLDLIHNFPGHYFRRIVTSFILFLQPGPNSVHFLVDYDFDRIHRYRDLWTQYLFFGGKVERPIQMLAPPMNLWVILFPLVLCVALREKPRGLFLYMLVTILWVTMVTSLIEIGENDRMRWEIEPFLVILIGVGVSRILLFLRRLKRPQLYSAG